MTDWNDNPRKRREVRQAKPLDAPIPHRASKDTKKWCGGKVGREHQLGCFIDGSYHFAPEHERPRNLACKVCGKNFDRWYPRDLFRRTKQKKPGWVDK